MLNWRDHKRAARRDVHRHMGVPALLMLDASSEPHPLTIRGPWTKRPVRIGDLDGGGSGWAEREDIAPRILFYREQLPFPLARGAIVSVEVGEAYRIGTVAEPDDETVTADVIPLTVAQAADLPVPD